MLFIFCQYDGEDIKKVNFKVFECVNQVLVCGWNILIFGEGFMDDMLIWFLKLVKKGVVCMGFFVLDVIGWDNYMIYVQVFGINYMDCNMVGFDLLFVNGNFICFNDFCEVYEQSLNKVINELIK